MIHRTRALSAIAVLALLLAGCGAFKPGAAATVKDKSISMESLDKLAKVYCEVTAVSAQQQGVRTVDNAEVRRQAITDLVLDRVGRDYAEKNDIAIPPPTEVDAAELVKPFGDRAPAVARAIAKSQDLFRLMAAVGGDDTNTPVTEETTEALAERGRAVLVNQFDALDVQFAPRLGLNKSGEPSGNNGSLSVAPVDLEGPAPDELPPGLSCTA